MKAKTRSRPTPPHHDQRRYAPASAVSEAGSNSGTAYGRLFARAYDEATQQLEQDGGAELRQTSSPKREDEPSSLVPGPDSTSSTTQRPSANSRSPNPIPTWSNACDADSKSLAGKQRSSKPQPNIYQSKPVSSTSSPPGRFVPSTIPRRSWGGRARTQAKGRFCS